MPSKSITWEKRGGKNSGYKSLKGKTPEELFRYEQNQHSTAAVSSSH